MGASLSSVQYEFNSPTGFVAVVRKSNTNVFAGLLPAYAGTAGIIWFTAADRASPPTSGFTMKSLPPAIRSVQINEKISTANVVTNSEVRFSAGLLNDPNAVIDVIYQVVNAGSPSITDSQNSTTASAPANQIFTRVKVVVNPNASVVIADGSFSDIPPPPTTTSAPITTTPIVLQQNASGDGLIVAILLGVVVVLAVGMATFFLMNRGKGSKRQKSDEDE